MNRLKGHRTYLCGPIENCVQNGIRWRRELTPWLKGLGIVVLDPTNKPIKLGNEDIENKKYVKQLRLKKDWNTLSKEMKNIIKVDLRLLDWSSFVIIYLSNNIPMAGTSHELVLTSQQRKPALIMCEDGKENISGWWYGLLNHKEFFSTWDELKNYISNIDSGKIEPNNKWLFLDKEVLNV